MRCPRCRSYSVKITTGGIVCYDCPYPNRENKISDDTEEITPEDEVAFYKKAFS